MPTPITRATAEVHEALFVRLAALLRQVEAVAARRPGAAVPPQTRAIAEALLFDTIPFTPRVLAPSASSRARRGTKACPPRPRALVGSGAGSARP